MKGYKEPIFIEKYNIYDIFYNENGELILITPYQNPYTIQYITDDTEKPFNLCVCPHKHTYIYSLKVEYTNQIKLKIMDEIIKTDVHVYPSFRDEIIMSTIVKDEDEFIRPWIDYHLRMGVSRFIIYDNSQKENLGNLLKEYINSNTVLLIKWKYPYRMEVSGISGQTTQQNHSIYAFRNSKYIGLFDIDEYVNIQSNRSIPSFLDEMIYKKQLDVSKIGSFKFLNKFFYNPDELPTTNLQFFNIFECSNVVDHGHEKNFVIPKNVNTFSVHMITHGHPSYNVPKTDAYFNHYYFLNKKDRGRNRTNQTDHSILLHLPNDICPSKQ